MQPIQVVRWSPEGDAVRVIDQSLLPDELIDRDLRTVSDVRDAIATFAVRGAPAIKVAAALGLAASLGDFSHEDGQTLRTRMQTSAKLLVAAQLTSVNLSWALDRMTARADGAAIVIERRHDDEVRRLAGIAVVPAAAAVRNPAFDVTPAVLITGIVTDKSVFTAPYQCTF